MSINSKSWVWGRTEDGRLIKVHTPFDCCVCGAPSLYGKDDKWYCLKDWLELQK